MKTLNQYIKEKLIINKDYVDVNMLIPKSFDELRKIIEDRYNKLGPGTEQNHIDFNDIAVSNLDSFYSNTYYRGLFEGTNFKYIDISSWDVSNVTHMGSMFFKCEVLKSVGDISGWNVSNVIDMSYMFAFCKKFNQDLSSWDVSKVRDKTGIFDCCPIEREYMPNFK